MNSSLVTVSVGSGVLDGYPRSCTWTWIIAWLSISPRSSFSRARSRAVLSSMNFPRRSDAHPSHVKTACLPYPHRMVFIVVLIVSRPRCTSSSPHLPLLLVPVIFPVTALAVHRLFSSRHAFVRCAVVDVGTSRPHSPIFLYLLPRSRLCTFPICDRRQSPMSISSISHIPCPIPIPASLSTCIYLFLPRPTLDAQYQ